MCCCCYFCWVGWWFDPFLILSYWAVSFVLPPLLSATNRPRSGATKLSSLELPCLLQIRSMEAQRRQRKGRRTNIREKKRKNRRKHRNIKNCRIWAAKSLPKNEIVCIRYLRVRQNHYKIFFQPPIYWIHETELLHWREIQTSTIKHLNNVTYIL